MRGSPTDPAAQGAGASWVCPLLGSWLAWSPGALPRSHRRSLRAPCITTITRSRHHRRSPCPQAPVREPSSHPLPQDLTSAHLGTPDSLPSPHPASGTSPPLLPLSVWALFSPCRATASPESSPEPSDTHRVLSPSSPGKPRRAGPRPRGVPPQTLPCPRCPGHSQSGRCSPRRLFCQDAAVIRELEDGGGPCAGCGVGRARWQLCDQAPWAEEGKGKGESGGSLPRHGRVFSRLRSLQAHPVREDSRDAPAPKYPDLRCITACKVQKTPVPSISRGCSSPPALPSSPCSLRTY